MAIKILDLITKASEFGDLSYALLKTSYELVRDGDVWSIKLSKGGRAEGTQVQICWMDYTNLKMWGLKLKLQVALEDGTNVDKLELPKVDGNIEVREIWEAKVRAKVPEISFTPTSFLEGESFSDRNVSFHDAIKSLEKIAIAIILRHCKVDERKESRGDKFRRGARTSRRW